MSEMNVSRDRADFKGEPSRENEVLTEAISQVPANVGVAGGELVVGKTHSISSPNKNQSNVVFTKLSGRNLLHK